MIFLSFADVKADNYADAREQIIQIITDLYVANEKLRDSGKLGRKDIEFFDQLGKDSDAIWSLLLASGYLKTIEVRGDDYELALTNYEVKKCFAKW